MDIVITTIITIKWSVRVRIAKIPLLLIFINFRFETCSANSWHLHQKSILEETNWIEILPISNLCHQIFPIYLFPIFLVNLAWIVVSLSNRLPRIFYRDETFPSCSAALPLNFTKVTAYLTSTSPLLPSSDLRRFANFRTADNALITAGDSESERESWRRFIPSRRMGKQDHPE